MGNRIRYTSRDQISSDAQTYSIYRPICHLVYIAPSLIHTMYVCMVVLNLTQDLIPNYIAKHMQRPSFPRSDQKPIRACIKNKNVCFTYSRHQNSRAHSRKKPISMLRPSLCTWYHQPLQLSSNPSQRTHQGQAPNRQASSRHSQGPILQYRGSSSLGS